MSGDRKNVELAEALFRYLGDEVAAERKYRRADKGMTISNFGNLSDVPMSTLLWLKNIVRRWDDNKIQDEPFGPSDGEEREFECLQFDEQMEKDLRSITKERLEKYDENIEHAVSVLDSMSKSRNDYFPCSVWMSDGEAREVERLQAEAKQEIPTLGLSDCEEQYILHMNKSRKY
jgi:hypothetical protein